MSSHDNKKRNKGDESAISRRALLAGAAGLAGTALIGPKAASSPKPQAAQDPTKRPGPPPSRVGQRSPFEQPARAASQSPNGSSRTPLQELRGIVTPSDLHFERHHAGVPQIDPNTYSLLIHGIQEKLHLSPNGLPSWLGL